MSAWLPKSTELGDLDLIQLSLLELESIATQRKLYWIPALASFSGFFSIFSLRLVKKQLNRSLAWFDYVIIIKLTWLLTNLTVLTHSKTSTVTVPGSIPVFFGLDYHSSACSCPLRLDHRFWFKLARSLLLALRFALIADYSYSLNPSILISISVQDSDSFMSSSTFNLNFNLAAFDNPLESAVLAENSLKSPIPDDDGFEIFDPRGLFSPPRPRLPAEDTQLNSSSLQQDHHPHPLQPQSTSRQISSSLISAAPRSWGLDCSQSMLKPHIIPVPTVFDDSIPDPPPRLTSPLDSPISPCSSSLPFCRSPPINESSTNHPISYFHSPTRRGRSSNPQQAHAPSSSLDPSPSSFPSSHSPRPRLGHDRYRPSPISTSSLPRDSSLPSRMSCSISSLAYSDMNSSPAVNFLAAFADATTPSTQHQTRSTSNVQASPKLVDEGDQVAGYTLGPIIGRGGFSVVRKARHIATNQNLAVKIVRRSEPIATADYPPSSSPLVYHGQHQNQINALKKAKPPVMSLHSSLNSRNRVTSTPLGFDGPLVNSVHLPLPTSVTENLAHALLKREIRIWSSLKQHPNLVSLSFVHETPTQTLLFMPICEGGNLLQFLNRVKLDPCEQDKLSQILNWTLADILSPSASSEQSEILTASSGLRLGLVREIFRQIVEGLGYLHLEANVVHKDIKLENILIQNNQIKISDFGLAIYPCYERSLLTSADTNKKNSSIWNRDLSLPKQFSCLPRIVEGTVGCSPISTFYNDLQSRSNLNDLSSFSNPISSHMDEDCDSATTDEILPTAAGSLAYTPPEQLRSEVPLACPSLDIWAVGCVLYGLLEGRLPFEDEFEPRLRLKIMNGQFEFPNVLSVDPEKTFALEEDPRIMITKVLKGSLAVDRNARWTIQEIAASAWLSPVNPSVTSPLSDDGRSSEGSFLSLVDQPSEFEHVMQLKRLASVLSEPEKTSDDVKMTKSDDIGSEPAVSRTFFTDPLQVNHSHSSSPKPQHEFLDFCELLDTIPSFSPSNGTPMSEHSKLDNQLLESAIPSLNCERAGRSRHRGQLDHSSSNVKILPRVSLRPSSRSHSRGRSPIVAHLINLVQGQVPIWCRSPRAAGPLAHGGQTRPQPNWLPRTYAGLLTDLLIKG
ncbi:hypothetical protein O181_045426 [Austropuccinia psidii MF-1]|uniref:Protein kinase domain-containing protein n=1 Tax=Austropuccinia psidii MF-1 TaxID=1389203 RepID=A0A9Q3DK78_9BASI|nr:hypothetical protein [Austropuccinia psidii MF-1]